MTKNADLYTLLDALELYETWFVPNASMRPGADVRCVTHNYNSRRKKSPGRLSYHTVEGGVLFVRVK